MPHLFYLLHTTVQEGKPAKHKHWSKNPRLLQLLTTTASTPGRALQEAGLIPHVPFLTNSLASGKAQQASASAFLRDCIVL